MLFTTGHTKNLVGHTGIFAINKWCDFIGKSLHFGLLHCITSSAAAQKKKFFWINVGTLATYILQTHLGDLNNAELVAYISSISTTILGIWGLGTKSAHSLHKPSMLRILMTGTTMNSSLPILPTRTLLYEASLRCLEVPQIVDLFCQSYRHMFLYLPSELVICPSP